MKLRQRGQTMAEYLVVALALVGAFYWASAAECEGYDNCLAKLKTVMHDKYEGYSNSITAVQQYGELKGEGFDAPPPLEPPGGGGGEETPTPPVVPQPPAPALTRTNLVVGQDGTVYGALNGLDVVDGNGNVIGTYDSQSGTLDLGDQTVGAGLVTTITDKDGNPVPPTAITDCETGDVYGFAYKSGGEFYDTLQLKPLVISDERCEEETTAVVDTEGKPVKGVVVNGHYYAAIEGPLRTTPVEPQGEVVWFDRVAVPDEPPYLLSLIHI